MAQVAETHIDLNEVFDQKFHSNNFLEQIMLKEI